MLAANELTKTLLSQARGTNVRGAGIGLSLVKHIAEAHGRSSPEETRRCLESALAACKEVQSHLYVGLDQAYLTLAEFQAAYGQADRVAGRIGGMLGKLDRQLTGRPARPPSRQKRA